LGRFINRDPIEEQGGLNLYAFCRNDGVNKWDYLGMFDDYVIGMDGGSSFAHKLVWEWKNEFGDPDDFAEMEEQAERAREERKAAADRAKLEEAQSRSNAGQSVTIVGANGQSQVFQPGDQIAQNEGGQVVAIATVATVAPNNADFFAQADAQAHDMSQMLASNSRMPGPRPRGYVRIDQGIFSGARPSPSGPGPMPADATITPLGGPRAPSAIRFTQPGEVFIRYEGGNPSFTRVTPNGGLQPGTYAAPSSQGVRPQQSLVELYNLPNPQIPREVFFWIRPPAGTPIVGPRSVVGGTGTEVFFPSGVPPGSTSAPSPTPTAPPATGTPPPRT
jgi:hypothetical protein